MSPPAWGWPASASSGAAGGKDVPTRVGMARKDGLQAYAQAGCPHPRGDGPEATFITLSMWPMSPPAWGWPEETAKGRLHERDVPTRVGMARHARSSSLISSGCPHPRGDGPLRVLRLWNGVKMSPPAWGWPEVFWSNGQPRKDVPTRVGMARRRTHQRACLDRCPHPRGDGPVSPW